MKTCHFSTFSACGSPGKHLALRAPLVIMAFRFVCWLILAFICDNQAVIVKRQTQPGGPFRQRLTLEELLEPSEINFLPANSPGAQVTNPSVNMNAVILENLDAGTLDLSMLQRAIADMLGPRQSFGQEDPMEPAEVGDGGMLILPSDGRPTTREAGSLINIFRILQRQQSHRSSANQQTLAAGSASEQFSSGQTGVRDFQTRPQGARPQAGSTNSRLSLSRLHELLNRLPQRFENLERLEQRRQSSPGDSHTGSQKQQTGQFTLGAPSTNQYNPQAGGGNWQSSQPRRVTDPVNGSRWSQSGRSHQKTWSESSNRLLPGGVMWPDNSETWQRNTESSSRLGNNQMGSDNPGIPEYPLGGSEYVEFGGNFPQPGSTPRQSESNYPQDQFNNQGRNQIYGNDARGNNANPQVRAPVNAPPATSDPATFVDNRPDLILKSRVSVRNQPELTPGQQLGTSNSQIRTEGSQPDLLDIPSGTTDSPSGSTNWQPSSQQNTPTNTQVSLNNIQAVLGETLTVVDNPPPVPTNTAVVTDPFVSPTEPMAMINPSDPSAPGAPANAPVDVPPEWTTPGLITPVPGKSSLLVIPGRLLGKKVYPNP